MIDIMPHSPSYNINGTLSTKAQNLNLKRLYSEHRIVELFLFVLITVSFVIALFFFLDGCSLVHKSSFSVPRFLSSSLATLSKLFVNGVTCNSQYMIGFPYLFIGFVDHSLAEVLVIGSFWFSFVFIFSIISVFIKLVLPFWSTTVIMFGSSSVIGVIVWSLFPGVIGLFLFRINFFLPLPHTGVLVVFSISSVLSSTFSSVLVYCIFLCVLCLFVLS